MPAFRGGAATEWAIKHFGGLMRVISGPQQSTLGTVFPILGADPERVGWGIINLGSSTLFIAFDESVSSTRGIYVGANGGSARSNVVEDANLPILPIYGICAAVQDFFVYQIRRESALQEQT